jgi:C1A family cysteine protease
MIFSLFLSMTIAGTLNVKALNQKLSQEKIGWKAKNTWVSELTEQEQRRMMGAPTVAPNAKLVDDYFEKSANDQFDWRDVDGINWLGPVMNQGNCGSCVSFATIATLEAQIAVSTKQPWHHPSFSTQALFACGGGSCDRGWFPNSAASYVVKKGVVDSACLPYSSGSTGADVQCRETCNDAGKRTYKAMETFKSGWLGTSTSDVIEKLKQGPLMVTMTVYKDFPAYAGGIYKATSNESLGGHAISLVGYNASERYWIIRNSWGEDWGENGFARISWDDKSGVGTSYNGFKVTEPDQILAIASPYDNAYVSDLSQIKVLHAAKVKDQVTTYLKNIKTSTVYSMDCIESVQDLCESQIEAGIPDGQYEIYAQARNFSSVRQRLVIVSQVPETLKISFDPKQYDWDNLKDRVEVVITTESSTVPFESVEFIVEDLNGKKVVHKKQREIFPKIKLGFRTTNLANGEYTLYYKGVLPVNGQKIEVETHKQKIKINN